MLPHGEMLEQSDGTAWMAKFCLNMLEMALRLANHDRAYEDVALKFFEHFASIAAAMGELWDEQDGFFYDRLRMPDGSILPVRARSMVGLLPLFAAVQLDASLWERLPDFRERANWFVSNKPQLARFLRYFAKGDRPELIALVDESRLRRVLARMLDESGVPLALRAALAVALPPRASAGRRAARRRGAARLRAGGVARAGSSAATRTGAGRSGSRSTSSRSNRCAICTPASAMASPSSCRPARACRRTSAQVADEIERRLLRLFLLDADGRRPVYGAIALFQTDPAWRDQLLFYEYFHGDTGEGLGASHQTGWTALAGALIAKRRGIAS